MKKVSKLSLTVIIIMAAASFTNLFGISAAGIAVMLGFIFFFINKKTEKQAFAGSGLEFKAIGKNLKQKNIWLWIVLPIIMDAFSILLAKLFLPEYIDHVLARVGNFLSFDNALLLSIQLPVMALGEEIAWRAFFQKQLTKVMPTAPVIIISSVLFAMGHIAEGSLYIVAFDIFFVFLNSIFYCIVFQKTNNAWISGFSHFAANLFSIIVLMFL